MSLNTALVWSSDCTSANWKGMSGFHMVLEPSHRTPRSDFSKSIAPCWAVARSHQSDNCFANINNTTGACNRADWHQSFGAAITCGFQPAGTYLGVTIQTLLFMAILQTNKLDQTFFLNKWEWNCTLKVHMGIEFDGEKTNGIENEMGIKLVDETTGAGKVWITDST